MSIKIKSGVSCFLATCLISVNLILLLSACSNSPGLTPTPANLTPSQTVNTLRLMPSDTTTATATQPKFTPVIAPTPTPLAKTLVMSNAVYLDPPLVPFPPAQSAPLPFGSFDLSQYAAALDSESKQDLTTVQAMQPPIYNIALRIGPDAKNAAAAGHEQIFYTNNTGEAQPDLYLWLYANAPITTTLNPPLAVSNVKVNGRTAAVQLENNLSNLHIKFDPTNPLQPNVTVAIELDFKLKVPTAIDTNYFRYDVANSIFALLYWYPEMAVFDRKLLGGWDIHPYNQIGDITNSATSFFKVWLTAPTSEIIVANAYTAQNKDNGDGTRTTEFISGPVRDFVAALSPNYATDSHKIGNTTVTSYFLQKDKVWGEKALGYAANALQTYRDAFGRFPYARYNVVEAPLSVWGGLEFPGLVYITTRYYEPSYLNSLEFAVAHETGHQWWYSTVGSDQIRHPWQDEALTQFSGLLYYERFHDEATAQRVYNTYFKAAYAALLNTNQDGVVESPVYAYQDINTYTTIVYNKGGLFFEAYRRQFGAAAFLGFARYYLEHNRYKFVGPDALLAALKQGVNSSNLLTVTGTPSPTTATTASQATDPTDQVAELYRHWIQAQEGAQDKAKL